MYGIMFVHSNISHERADEVYAVPLPESLLTWTPAARLLHYGIALRYT